MVIFLLFFLISNERQPQHATEASRETPRGRNYDLPLIAYASEPPLFPRLTRANTFNTRSPPVPRRIDALIHLPSPLPAPPVTFILPARCSCPAGALSARPRLRRLLQCLMRLRASTKRSAPASTASGLCGYSGTRCYDVPLLGCCYALLGGCYGYRGVYPVLLFFPLYSYAIQFMFKKSYY